MFVFWIVSIRMGFNPRFRACGEVLELFEDVSVERTPDRDRAGKNA